MQHLHAAAVREENVRGHCTITVSILNVYSALPRLEAIRKWIFGHSLSSKFHTARPFSAHTTATPATATMVLWKLLSPWGSHARGVLYTAACTACQPVRRLRGPWLSTENAGLRAVPTCSCLSASLLAIFVCAHPHIPVKFHACTPRTQQTCAHLCAQDGSTRLCVL